MTKARSEQDHLPFPGKYKIGEIESAELTRLLASWEIKGVSASNPRSTNLDKYSQHIDALRKAAGDDAVYFWCRDKGLPEVVDATLPAADVARLLSAIPGVSASNGKSTNIEIYQSHLDSIRKRKAESALKFFLWASDTK